MSGTERNEALAARGADRGSLLGARGREREGDYSPDERAQERHLEGFQDAGGRLAERDRREVGREHPGEESFDRAGAGE